MIIMHIFGTEFTKGELMFYGGIGAFVLLTIVSIILIVLFRSGKKKLISKIEREY